MIKIPKNVETETDFINQVKHICENLTANIELHGEKLQVFLFWLKRREDAHTHHICQALCWNIY